MPDAVRGKNTAIRRILSSLATLVAITAAGYVLGSDPDLSRFYRDLAFEVVRGGQDAEAGSRFGALAMRRDIHSPI